MHEAVSTDVANPYAAPEHLGSAEAVGTGSRFYVVAPRKFLILFLGTLGLYLLYWMYAQWASYRRATKGSEWPVARAIFAVFFVHALFAEIDLALRRSGSKLAWSPGMSATWAVVLMIVSTVCDRLAARSIGSPATDLLGLAVMFVVPFPLLAAQRAANAACGDPEGASNAGMTAANVAWLVFGAILWVLTVLGTLALLGVIEA
jgi:hypothetical protein